MSSPTYKDGAQAPDDLQVTVIAGKDTNGAVQALLVSDTGGLSASVDTTGLATTAKQDTIIGHVDGIEASLTTIAGHVDTVESLLGTSNTNTGNTASSVSTIATNTGNSATSLAVLDDWDSFDRCKVSPIEGADGIAGGAGSTTAATTRTRTALDSQEVVSLEIIDDWDESDRCKVNPIAGQVGVAAGSGAISATTQRVALATDTYLPSEAASFRTIVDYPFGSISGTYSVAYTNSAKLVRIKIVNGTAGGMFISFDGTNDHLIVTSGASETVELGQYRLHHSGNIWVKGTPVSGAVQFQCVARP